VAVVLTLHNYNKKHTISTTKNNVNKDFLKEIKNKLKQDKTHHIKEHWCTIEK
jgi:hypothetical protein